MPRQFANSGDPDQRPHCAASDLGLHCLPLVPFWGLQTKMGFNPSLSPAEPRVCPVFAISVDPDHQLIWICTVCH